MASPSKKRKKLKQKQEPPVTQKLRPAKKDAVLPWLLLAIGITTLTLFPILNNGFTNWDDEQYVINNALLRGPDWYGIFTQPVVSNYHPLTIITLAINFAISGTDPWSYLLLNQLLHLANTALVFYFIYAISNKNKWIAFLTSIVFGIHPMHVESVAWISERKDVLYTLFFLLALLQYWRYLKTGKVFRLWVCFLFFILSLLSKPAAIVLPLVLLLLDYWYQRPFSKKNIFEKIPFFLFAGLFTILVLQIQSKTAMVDLDLYPLWARLFFACYVIMIYFLRFFIPYPLSSFHPYPPPDDLGLPVLLAPLFVLALLFIIWRYRKNRLLIFGLLFFFINILLVLQIISIGFTIVSERYTYVPYIGLAFAMFMLVNKYITTKTLLLARATAILAGIIFCILSFTRTRVWKDSDSLWSDVIKKYPEASLPRGNRAQLSYNKALLMAPAESASLFQRVIEDCTVAIDKSIESEMKDISKGGTSLYLMRGVSFANLKQYEKAISDFNIGLNYNPGNEGILSNRGMLLFNQYKNYSAALSDFSNAININPKGEYFLNRSRCYYMLGDFAKAKQDVQYAIEKGSVVSADYRRLLGI